jgi:hypothetical protein
MINALLASGGMTDEEKMAAIESCAEHSNIEVKLNRWRTRRNLNVSRDSPLIEVEIGRVLTAQKYVSEPVAIGLIARIKRLLGEKSDLARKLWLIVQQWDYPSVDIAIVKSIAEGRADLETVINAPERRESLRKTRSTCCWRRARMAVTRPV